MGHTSSNEICLHAANKSVHLQNWVMHASDPSILINLATKEQATKHHVLISPEELKASLEGYSARTHQHFTCICRVFYFHQVITSKVKNYGSNEERLERYKNGKDAAEATEYYVYTDRMIPIRDIVWSKERILMVFKAVRRLASVYGFFKVTEKMIAENQRKQMKVWINENPALNYRQQEYQYEEHTLADIAGILVKKNEQIATLLMGTRTLKDAADKISKYHYKEFDNFYHNYSHRTENEDLSGHRTLDLQLNAHGAYRNVFNSEETGLTQDRDMQPKNYQLSNFKMAKSIQKGMHFKNPSARPQQLRDHPSPNHSQHSHHSKTPPGIEPPSPKFADEQKRKGNTTNMSKLKELFDANAVGYPSKVQPSKPSKLTNKSTPKIVIPGNQSSLEFRKVKNMVTITPQNNAGSAISYYQLKKPSGNHSPMQFAQPNLSALASFGYHSNNYELNAINRQNNTLTPKNKGNEKDEQTKQPQPKAKDRFHHNQGSHNVLNNKSTKSQANPLYLKSQAHPISITHNHNISGFPATGKPGQHGFEVTIINNNVNNFINNIPHLPQKQESISSNSSTHYHQGMQAHEHQKHNSSSQSPMMNLFSPTIQKQQTQLPAHINSSGYQFYKKTNPKPTDQKKESTSREFFNTSSPDENPYNHSIKSYNYAAKDNKEIKKNQKSQNIPLFIQQRKKLPSAYSEEQSIENKFDHQSNATAKASPQQQNIPSFSSFDTKSNSSTIKQQGSSTQTHKHFTVHTPSVTDTLSVQRIHTQKYHQNNSQILSYSKPTHYLKTQQYDMRSRQGEIDSVRGLSYFDEFPHESEEHTLTNTNYGVKKYSDYKVPRTKTTEFHSGANQLTPKNQYKREVQKDHKGEAAPLVNKSFTKGQPQQYIQGTTSQFIGKKAQQQPEITALNLKGIQNSYYNHSDPNYMQNMTDNDQNQNHKRYILNMNIAHLKFAQKSNRIDEEMTNQNIQTSKSIQFQQNENKDAEKTENKMKLKKQIKMQFNILLDDPIKSRGEQTNDPPLKKSAEESSGKQKSRTSNISNSSGGQNYQYHSSHQEIQRNNQASPTHSKNASIGYGIQSLKKDQMIKEKVQKKKAAFAELKMEAMKVLADDFL